MHTFKAVHFLGVLDCGTSLVGGLRLDRPRTERLRPRGSKGIARHSAVAMGPLSMRQKASGAMDWT